MTVLQSHWSSAAAALAFATCLAGSIGAQTGSYFTGLEPIPELDDPNADERSPTTNDAETYMVFATNRKGGKGKYDLWQTRRPDVGAKWSAAQPITQLNSAHDDMMPDISLDGLELHFVRDDGTASDVWVARRRSVKRPWGQPARLGKPVNDTGISNGLPKLTKDGRTMFLTRKIGSSGLDGVCCTRRSARNQPWGAPTPFAPAHAMTGATSCAIPNANGERVFFMNQPTTNGKRNWYLTHKEQNSSWSKPVVLPHLGSLDALEGCRRSSTGNFHAVVSRNGLLAIHRLCFKHVDIYIEYCVDFDLVPVWDPILQMYIYTEVWEMKTATVTDLVAYSWSKFPSVVAWVISDAIVTSPIHINGVGGAPLLLNPANVHVVATTSMPSNGQAKLHVNIPNKQSLVGKSAFVQGVIVESTTPKKLRLSTPIEMRIK